MDAGVDRISNLHDSLIHHILSFLPAKCAVSTSVLSKRWNNLWISMPVFDFREWLPQTVTYAQWNDPNRFMDFFDRKLFSKNISTIKKVYLNCDNDPRFNENRVREWITALVKTSKVEELILVARWWNSKLVPSELFTCESLTTVDFEFQSGYVFDFPKSISLPRLKVLRLWRVDFKDDMALTQQLFSNCPILEELSLRGCNGKGNVISFSALRLKYLTLVSCGGLKFEIDAPNLVSINYAGCVPRNFPLSSCPSLVKADFLYSSDCNESTTMDSLSKFIRMCSNIHLLKASYRYLQIFDIITNVASTSFPVYDNLLRLEVHFRPYYTPPSISSLFNFLHFSPNLESLVINQVHRTKELNGDELTLNMAPHCLLLHLKSIQFRNFDGSPKEMELVKLFLKYARILDQLVMIITGEYSSTKIIKKLQRFPRASAHCSFQLCT